MTEREWVLAEKHYSFLVPHIRHYQSLDETGRAQLKEIMGVKQGDKQKKDKPKSGTGGWPGGSRSAGMTRFSRLVYVFYVLFGGGVIFGCYVAEGYRSRWDELPFHP